MTRQEFLDKWSQIIELDLCHDGEEMAKEFEEDFETVVLLRAEIIKKDGGFEHPNRRDMYDDDYAK